jgi:hypothetical protein
VSSREDHGLMAQPMQLGDDGSANQPSAACYRNAHAHLPFLYAAASLVYVDLDGGHQITEVGVIAIPERKAWDSGRLIAWPARQESG